MKEKDCLYGWLRLRLLSSPVTQMGIILRLRHLALVLLLLMSMGVNGVWGQTDITALSDIADPTGYYRLTSDVSGAGHTSIATFSGTLEAAIDPTTKMPFRITGLDKPLFTTLTGTVRNLVLEDVSISGNTGNTGAIAATAEGTARIYNIGILSGSVGGTGNTGGLVGLLRGTAHVVNCYSYATITGGSNVGGIVGNNNTTTKSGSINTMVMNCMFYGDITGGSTVSPVYGGTNIANLRHNSDRAQDGLNTFNYYAYDELKTTAISNNKYNSALAVEQKYLNRFEFYRLLLNSNKKLAAFYATGNVADSGLMLKWVLETADRTIDNPKPYPILKAQGKYPSIINPDFENAPDSTTVGRNHGGKLPSPRNTLTVTISSAQTTGGQTKPTGATITTSSLTLVRTDKDFDRFNYNYDKVQLPYYNDVGTGNYTGNRVVTGWKITAITAITGDPYTSANYPTTGITDFPNHNYADRKSSNKDLYSVSGRVFSQGAYFDVPYGVTSITIEPYWGKAYYLADQYYDVVYSADYKTKQGVSQTGTQVNTSSTLFNGQNVETSIERALNNINNNMGGWGPTVYDNALVLVGNLHLNTVPQNGTTPFTMMSVDENNDHEPDYSLIYHHTGRSSVTPIRFDFLNIPGTAQAQKPNGASLICNFTIFKTRGWFETTNTALFYTSQLEYENLDNNTKTDAPLILLGGVVDQFVSTQSKTVTGKTIYIHVGGNVWIQEFGMGTHSDGSQSTPHVPVSVTGGEFPGFYLTGTYNANATIREDNAECYISGGYFHEVAGASQEGIKGNVRWQIYNADIDQFFGGGINEAKPIQGTITTDIYNSYVTLFCGGPKFGNMTAGKAVTTNAEGCTFGNYFGAGYGGNSYSRKKYYDNSGNQNWATLQGYYTGDRGEYYNGVSTGSSQTSGKDYGKKGPGVATDFDYEFFVWSSGTTGARLFVKFVSFSLAQCDNVSSTLKKCTINENFYGGGSLGKVSGTATSELEDCTVMGNAFGAGYSATLPTIPVRMGGFTTNPNYNQNSGMFEPGIYTGTEEFTWKQVASYPAEGGAGFDGTQVITTQNLDKTNLGSVGNVQLTIKGTTEVKGSVYGGGEESVVTGNTVVNIEGGTIGTGGLGGADYGNVYGGGKGMDNDVKAGWVQGNTTVNISSLPDNNTTKVLHNVYGGGAFGSVGTFTYDDSNSITGYTSGGQATVNIVGGTIGTDGHDNGMVFGSSRGKEGNPLTDTNIDKLAWVCNTLVNVGTAGSATGPMVNGSVYGGGENGHNYQNAEVNIHSGTIGYTSYDPASGYNCGSVFGAGCGTDKYTVGEVQHYNPLAGTVWGNTTIAIDGGHIRHNVYGGGAIGSAGKADGSAGKATITVTGGRIGTDGNDNGNIYGAPRGDSEATDADIAQVVDTEVNINYATTPTGDNTEHTAQLIAGSVFGGGQSGVVRHSVVVNMNGGLVLNDIYGGSALANTNIGNATGYGTSSEAITSTSAYTTALNLHGGIVGHNVYGGGLGRKAATGVTPVAALVYGDVMVKLNETIATDDCIVKGDVFGCNNYNGTPKGIPTVHVYKTVGYDDSHKKSTDKDDTTYDLQAVYGGGNEAAYQPALSTSSTNVIIDGCDLTSIQYVYGGGNAAPAPATQVTVNSCYEIGSLFGGGNGYDDLEDGTPNPGADVGLINGSPYGSGDANTLLYGGKVHEAYGASNFKGTIRGAINLDVHDGGVCALQVDKVVGAGKNADIDGDVIVVMGCMPTTKTPLVFGGADNANVNGNVELTITSGTFGQIFGGNNLGGVIKGHIKVNIEETGCNPVRINELYLGGNQAAYSVFGYYDSGETLSNGKVKYLPRTSEEDTHTAIPNPVTDATHTFPYAQPVMNVTSCTRIDSVFGGGLGSGAVMYANPTVNINMVQGAFANDLPVDADNNPNKLGAVENVYGGGNEAAVYGNTTVNIGTLVNQNIVLTSPEGETEANRTKQVLGAFITGTVYGAGKGLATDPDAAIVTGNTQVNMGGGHVSRSIYGGGELGSVGTFTETYAATSGNATDGDYHVKGEPKTCAANTGKTEVIISGGQVGLVNQLMPDPSRPTSDDDYGYVFCAGKGMADPTETNLDGVPYANLLAVSGSSHLEVSGGLVAASVYGGSENGQVLGNTYVEIKGGQIGSGHYVENGEDKWDPAYTDEQWNSAIGKIKAGTFTDADAAAFHECDAWPFGPEGSRYVYDHYAEYESNGEYYYDAALQQPAHGGSKSGSDGHSYYGHVFGGGSGYYPYAAGQWRRTAGRVNGNTLVEISGGHILTNVYGGNEITDVLGGSKVEMWGGTVGVPRTLAGIQARPVNSYIFGGGMGDPRVLFNGWSNVGSAEVIVRDNAVVFGSVFGGGEDGHVLGNVSTTITGNVLIGTFGSSGVDGNVFGSGRGFSTRALTAGAVCGNVTVNIAERAKILGSIFGGGRMAAVGTYIVGDDDSNYGKLIAEGQDPYGTGSTTHGNVTINITGGTIGNLSQLNSSQYSIGDVFGGSKGVYINGEWTKSQKLGLVKNTTVNISGSNTRIYGNVYGGGEIASVGSYKYADATDVSSYNSTHITEPLTVGDVYQLLESNTGKATILITGGTIGQSDPSDTHGHVFGGCLGRAGTDYSGYSFVNESVVTLENGTVYGSIFGGGENGHVLDDTNVNIRGGSVGIRLDNLTGTIPENTIYRGNVYGGGRGIDTYDNNGTNTYSITAGKVSGHTTVSITGGQIYRNVYGGGSLASVGDPDEDSGGLASVNITGGKIGTDGGYHGGSFVHLLENGHVFGSGRGVAGGATDDFIRLAYVKNTQVTIGGTAYVTGSVFGSGENGHVRKNTIVTVNAGTGYSHEQAPTSEDIEPYPIIGYPLTQAEMVESPTSPVMIYRGNVYGGGRGIDHTTANHLSETAGAVKGNATVNINGGTIRHNVYGGGSLASTGDITDENGVIVYHDVDGNPTGEATVNISGGLIGMSPLLDICKNGADTYSGLNNGQVYGGARGVAAGPGQTAGSVESEYVVMAYVHDTQVNVSGTAKVFGSVFGGGANGHVSRNTVVNVSGGEIGTDPAVLGAASNYYYMDPATGIDGHVIYTGNVYGGGRGIDRNEGGDLSATAGRVYGNTKVNIIGGQIYHNVYGGGSLASVGTFTKSGTTYTWTENTGKSEVIISGGTVGFEDFSMEDYLTYMGSHPGTDPSTIFGNFTKFKFNTGRVFGSGRGMAGAEYTEYAYVRDAYVTIQGTGAVKGNVFGSGENGHVKRNTYVEIKGGTVGYKVPSLFLGNVYGGGRGVDLYNGAVSVTAGRTEGNSNVTISGGKIYRDVYGGGSLASVGQAADSSTGLATVTIETGGTIGDDFCVANGFGGNVFGSGRGMVKMATGPDYSQMAYVNNTEVIIKGHVMGNVYGGGNAGHVRHATHVQILDGALVGTNYGGNVYYGNVFGAGKGTSRSGDYSATAGAVLGSVVVDMLGGTVLNDVYGGAALANSNIGNASDYGTASEAISSTSTNTTTVNLVGGTINNAYGGGQGDDATAAIVYGDASVLLNGSAATGATNNCKVKGYIFGGNNINGTPKGHALVHIYKTAGYDDTHKKSTDKDNTTYDVAAVYGGGNMAAYEPVSDADFAEVVIDGCDDTSVKTVYGGGNAASAPATRVTVNGTYEIGAVFGGGNGKDALPNGDPNPGAHVGLLAYPNAAGDAYSTKEERAANYGYGTGKAHVMVYGGTVHEVYGGSNTKGNVRVEARATLEDKGLCDFNLGEAYGGGRNAEMDGDAVLEIGCISGLGKAYGGAADADVEGDVVLNITNGTYGQVFGGNDMGGNISGSITVNIEETGCNPIIIGELYGGGNEAAYTAPTGTKSPVVNVKSFTSIGTIYGGGYGAAAEIKGNPTVNIDVFEGIHKETVIAQNARVIGSTVKKPGDEGYSTTAGFEVPSHAANAIGAIGTVFGGGNAAKVVGNTYVNIGTEEYMPVTVAAGSSVQGYYTRSGAGTESSPYTYSAASGTATGSTTYYAKVVGVDIRGNVFGGGNQAEVEGDTNVVVGR